LPEGRGRRPKRRPDLVVFVLLHLNVCRPTEILMVMLSVPSALAGVLLIYLDQSWQAITAKRRDQLAGASGVVSHRPGAYASPDKIATSSVRTLALRLASLLPFQPQVEAAREPA